MRPSIFISAILAPESVLQESLYGFFCPNFLLSSTTKKWTNLKRKKPLPHLSKNALSPLILQKFFQYIKCGNTQQKHKNTLTQNVTIIGRFSEPLTSLRSETVPFHSRISVCLRVAYVCMCVCVGGVNMKVGRPEWRRALCLGRFSSTKELPEIWSNFRQRNWTPPSESSINFGDILYQQIAHTNAWA